MDSITQAVLGAGIAGAVMGRTQGRRALLYGAILGTLPDLDVLASYPDPVSTMTFHRGYSHSVFVLTAGAVALAAVARRFFPSPHYSPWRLFLAIWLVLITHPILDAFTSYGTQLFWPLGWTPESWSSVFIIDPAYTLPMLIAVLFAAARGFDRGKASVLALRYTVGLSCLYLAFSLVAKSQADTRVRQAALAEGYTVERVFSAPMPLNTLLWRVVVQTSDDTYLEAVTGVFDRGPPQILEQSLNRSLAHSLSRSGLHGRLQWFTDDWLRYDAIGSDLVVTDLRMGMPGYYTFRFKMAERDAAGQWCPVVPQLWTRNRGGMDELRLILARVGDEHRALPLAQWARANTEPADLPAAVRLPAQCNLPQ